SAQFSVGRANVTLRHSGYCRLRRRRQCALLSPCLIRGAEMIRILFTFYLLLASSARSKEINYRTFVAGKVAYLPCSIDPPMDNDKMTLVLWYKDGSESPIYGLDARSAPSHFVDDQLGARASFSTTVDNASLKINPVKASDRGFYRCRVDFAHSRTVYHHVQLEIVVPPKKILLRNSDGKIIQEELGPYREGMEVRIVCEVTGGNPRPTVTWLVNGPVVQDRPPLESEEKSSKVIRKELILSKLSRKDYGSVLLCQATNNNISSPVAKATMITLELEPLSVAITTSKESLLDGKRVSVVCQSTGSRPSAIFKWIIEDRDVTSLADINISNDHNLTTSTLTFTPTATDNGALLICEVHTANIPLKALKDEWKLNVLHAPRVMAVITSHQGGIWIKENDDVSLRCVASSNPPVTSIRWFYNDRPIPDTKSSSRMSHEEILNMNTNQDFLVISEIDRRQSGTFRCEAINEVNAVSSNVVRIEVKYVPKCKEDLRNAYIVGRSEAVKVLCDVDSLPPHVTFTWVFRNINHEYLLSTFESKNTSSMATYIPQSKSDYGELQCWAKNSVGDQAEPCTFKIVHADRPEPVYNCTVQNTTSSSFVIACLEGHDGGLRQRFVMEIYDEWTYALQMNVTSNTTPEFDVRELEPDANYMVIIYSSNSKGRSSSRGLKVHTLTMTGVSGVKMSLFTTITPVLGIMIGFAGLVFLFIFVIVILKVTKLKKSKEVAKKSTEKVKTKPVTTNDKYDEHKADQPLLKSEKTEPTYSNIVDANANNKSINNGIT
ncbi:Uncharacterised protein PB.6989, partial [Pycnogonum litorale]